VGQTSNASVTLSNQGAAPVEISQLNITGQSFSISGQSSLPMTVAANGSVALTIQFSPAASGPVTGQLTITSNALTGTSTAVNLSGTGVPVLSGLTCTSGSMTGAGLDSCTATLNAAAASGGLQVSLASSNSAVVVPASVTVPAGANSADFSASVSPVTSVQSSTITASLGGVAQTFALQLGASVPALSLSASSLAFGRVPVNSAATQPLVLSSTGTAAVTVSAETLAGSGFSISNDVLPVTLNPNQTATLTVHFDPTTAEAAAGQLTLTSNSSSGTSTVVTLSGTGVPVLSALSCTSGSFTGSGTDSCTVTLNAAAATGGFTVSLASNNSTVTVPASVTVAAGATTAAFTATVSSVTIAQTVTLTASAGSVSKTFALSLGAAVPTISVNATTIAFGDVDLNSPATQSLTLSSTGTAAVTVSAVTLTGTGFTVSGATFPLTLNPGQTATLSIEFDPTAAGAVSGSLTLTSNSCTGSSTVITLTGTGSATSYEVNLTWDAPTTSTDPVAGYNVYRSPSGATSYQELNTSAITQTSYVDTAVQAGQAYDYIVESVDASGVTSAPSNMASATIQ
jgi:hypothetical protein